MRATHVDGRERERRMNRPEMLALLAQRIGALSCAHPTRVAVDGVDAAGKTTLAAELAQALGVLGRSVIRASLDGFHRPRAQRYRRGADSPQGYYEDSFDYPALRTCLLDPLGPGGSRRFRRAVFDVRTDTELDLPEELAPADAILLCDGVFLLRTQLAACWDYRIFVAVPFAVALARAQVRDRATLGSAAAVRARYRQRYIPGQRLYLAAAHPRARADAVVSNADLAHPTVTFAAPHQS